MRTGTPARFSWCAVSTKREKYNFIGLSVGITGTRWPLGPYFFRPQQEVNSGVQRITQMMLRAFPSRYLPATHSSRAECGAAHIYSRMIGSGRTDNPVPLESDRRHHAPFTTGVKRQRSQLRTTFP